MKTDNVLVPRKLLERILSYSWFPSGATEGRDLRLLDREKLRALLAQPVSADPVAFYWSSADGKHGPYFGSPIDGAVARAAASGAVPVCLYANPPAPQCAEVPLYAEVRAIVNQWLRPDGLSDRAAMVAIVNVFNSAPVAVVPDALRNEALLFIQAQLTAADDDDAAADELEHTGSGDEFGACLCSAKRRRDAARLVERLLDAALAGGAQ